MNSSEPLAPLWSKNLLEVDGRGFIFGLRFVQGLKT